MLLTTYQLKPAWEIIFCTRLEVSIILYSKIEKAGVYPKIVKLLFKIISEHLSHIYNMSLSVAKNCMFRQIVFTKSEKKS